jgi:hypothetical protein
MTDCPQNIINHIWRLFAGQGIGDDTQIIEALAHRLLRLEGHSALVNHSSYPQAAILNETRSEELDMHLHTALAEHTAANLLNYCLLFQPDNMQAGGRYPTPRHITRLMADLARLFVSESGVSVIDFACGSGGLLVEFDDCELRGSEIAATWARIARANLTLHGFSAEQIQTVDALNLHSYFDTSADIIVMNPPFGAPMEAERVRARLGEGTGTRSETVLALLALRNLKSGGVMTTLQPGGALFSTSSGEVTLRTLLLAENRLEAIIQLPKDAFQPFSQLQTYLLLASNSEQSSIEADAPVWFYNIAHDGFSSGRNRQPEPELSQLPQLVAAIEARQTDEAWNLVDAVGVAQLNVQPLSTGGYRATQPCTGKLSVRIVSTSDSRVLWLTRQTDKTQHGLVQEGALWQIGSLPELRDALNLNALTFQLADDDGETVRLAQQSGEWSFVLKSQVIAKLAESLNPESGFLALFVATSGEPLSPVLLIDDIHKNYRPKKVAILPLAQAEDEIAGNLLLWDAGAAMPLYFAGEVENMGWLLVAGDEEAALIKLEDGVVCYADSGSLTQAFKGESWHRGVVLNRTGQCFGVAVDPKYIRDERDFDLTFDRYYLPDESQPTMDKSAAELLADMRQKQRELAGRLDYLLGVIEMRSTPAVPQAVVEAAPIAPLNKRQQDIWQRISQMTETTNGVVTARPFRLEKLQAPTLDVADVEQAVALFERMGLIVSVAIDGAPYYRRVTERDVVPT